jgi:hypothetical protein
VRESRIIEVTVLAQAIDYSFNDGGGRAPSFE